MENVNFEKDNIVFNYRVGAVIKNKDKILVEQNSKVDYYILPGGRCEIGEDSVNATIREFKEETGFDINLKRKIGMIENFFKSTYNGKNYHEIFIVHEMECTDKNLYNLEIVETIEDDKKDYITYSWKTISELKKVKFQPTIVLDIINEETFQHIINKD